MKRVILRMFLWLIWMLPWACVHAFPSRVTNTRCMDGFFSVGTLEVPAELLEGPSRLAALPQGAFKELVRLFIEMPAC